MPWAYEDPKIGTRPTPITSCTVVYKTESLTGFWVLRYIQNKEDCASNTVNYENPTLRHRVDNNTVRYGTYRKKRTLPE